MRSRKSGHFMVGLYEVWFLGNVLVFIGIKKICNLVGPPFGERERNGRVEKAFGLYFPRNCLCTTVLPPEILSYYERDVAGQLKMVLFSPTCNQSREYQL